MACRGGRGVRVGWNGVAQGLLAMAQRIALDAAERIRDHLHGTTSGLRRYVQDIPERRGHSQAEEGWHVEAEELVVCQPDGVQEGRTRQGSCELASADRSDRSLFECVQYSEEAS